MADGTAAGSRSRPAPTPARVPHRANPLGEADALLTPHAQCLALGARPAERRRAYRDFVASAIPNNELDLIRQRLQRQHALGSDRFRALIETQLARPAGPRRPGRPRKAADLPGVVESRA